MILVFGIHVKNDVSPATFFIFSKYWIFGVLGSEERERGEGVKRAKNDP